MPSSSWLRPNLLGCCPMRKVAQVRHANAFFSFATMYRLRSGYDASFAETYPVGCQAAISVGVLGFLLNVTLPAVGAWRAMVAQIQHHSRHGLLLIFFLTPLHFTSAFHKKYVCDNTREYKQRLYKHVSYGLSTCLSTTLAGKAGDCGFLLRFYCVFMSGSLTKKGMRCSRIIKLGSAYPRPFGSAKVLSINQQCISFVGIHVSGRFLVSDDNAWSGQTVVL